MRKWINDLGMIVLALILALVVWFVAVQEENPIVEGEYPTSIPVEVRNRPPGTTLLPATFDESILLAIRAPQSSWQDLRPDKFSAWIDLKGYEAGDYEVPVQYSVTDQNVRVQGSRPGTVPVHLKEEISRIVPVQIQLYGSPALGFEIDSDGAIIAPETVTVTGAAPIVEQVSKATVDLYLQEVKEPWTGERRVVARQANDESVGGFVAIQPPTVQITIPVLQRTGFQEVVVRPRLTGTVALGYLVRGVSVEPLVVLLGGDPDVVSKVTGFVETMPLDISEATDDVVERLALDLPEGASPVGVQGVLVTVDVEPQQASLTVVRRPIVRGLSTELVATVVPEEVEVALIGPAPRLNALSDEDLYVYVDLVDKGPGQHRVELTTLAPEGVEVVTISPGLVDVEISRALVTPTATSTARPRATATSTPRPSPTVTVTVTPTGTVTAQ